MIVRETREEIIRLVRLDPELALHRANEVIKNMPDEAWAWALRSYVCRVLGDFGNAMRDIDQAIDIKFDDPGSHFHKGHLLLSLGATQYREAIASFSHSIEIGERINNRYNDTVSRFMRAFCYCRIEEFDKAKADLSQLEDGIEMWIDQLRSKDELLQAVEKGRLD